jgi:hypothetical protein
MFYDAQNTESREGVLVKTHFMRSGNRPGELSQTTCSVVYASKVQMMDSLNPCKSIGWFEFDRKYVVAVSFDLNGKRHHVEMHRLLCSVNEHNQLQVVKEFVDNSYAGGESLFENISYDGVSKCPEDAVISSIYNNNADESFYYLTWE